MEEIELKVEVNCQRGRISFRITNLSGKEIRLVIREISETGFEESHLAPGAWVDWGRTGYGICDFLVFEVCVWVADTLQIRDCPLIFWELLQD